MWSKSKHSGRTAGVMLILLGTVFLALQHADSRISGSAILFAIGIALIAAYFYRRAYGLLIPGCILLGIALGSVGSEGIFTVGDFGALGFGLGFVAIYLIDRAYRGSTHWWPLVPGGLLVVTGLRDADRLFAAGWPLFFIFVGLLLFAGVLTQIERREDAEMEQAEEAKPR